MKTRPDSIDVGIVSKDSCFAFWMRSLIGKDRSTREVSRGDSFAQVMAHSHARRKLPHVVVCDVDSLVAEPGFLADMARFAGAQPSVKILCVVESSIRSVRTLDLASMRGLVTKQDVLYCVHVAVQHIYDTSDFLLSTEIERSLPSIPRGTLTLMPSEPIPALAALGGNYHLIAEARIFNGLDNEDIQSELDLRGEHPVRDALSKIYKALDITGKEKELQLFNRLSDWYRCTRFIR